MPGSNGNGLRPEEEHVLGMSNTEDVSSVNDGKKSLSAWLGFATAVGGLAGNLWMNERNNRYNREQNEQAYQQNLQMWNSQNAYNLPANQIERLRQAGLNPNLIYGNPENTAGAPPEKQGAKGERGELDPMAIANAMLMQKQMEGIESQKEVNAATARDLIATSEGKEIDNKMKQFDLDKQEDVYERNKREQEANINLISKTADKISVDMDYFRQLSNESFMRESKLKIERDFLKETKEYDKMFKVLGIFSTISEIEKSKATVADFYSQILYRKKKGEKIDAEIITECLKQSNLIADIKLKDIESIIKMASSEYNVGLLYQKMLEGTATPQEIDEFKLKYLQDYLKGFTGMGALGKFTALILLGTFM